MFTVLVQSSKRTIKLSNGKTLVTSGQWRSIEASTMSEVVMLTLGLTCRFRICNHGNIAIAKLDCGSIVNVGNTALLPKYYHALRSLICRWVKRTNVDTEEARADLRFYFRLSDLELLKAIRNAAEYSSLLIDPFAVDSNPELTN